MSNATIIDLAPATLLRAESTGFVASFRHCSLLIAQRRRARMEAGAIEVMRRVQRGYLTMVDAGSAPSIPTCSVCGCTEEFACTQTCAWADASKTLCTACKAAEAAAV